jgi:hypothetical protein
MNLSVTKKQLEDVVSVFEGKNEDEVADIVRAELNGEKADCGNPHSCAIAKFVLRRIPALERDSRREELSVAPQTVSVADYDAAIESDEFWGFTVDLPEGVTDFIGSFDHGQYPDLATEESLQHLHQAFADA